MEHPRWNDFVRWQSVRYDGDEHAMARGVRLACASARVGDPVRITDRSGEEREGVIVEVHSTLVVDVRRGYTASRPHLMES